LNQFSHVQHGLSTSVDESEDVYCYYHVLNEVEVIRTFA